MLRSLRDRLILSHILPALLIIPLMGAAMVYVLETRVLLPMIYGDLARDATLMAEITRNQPVFWQNSQAAQALIDGVSPYVSGRLSFVTSDGRILATSETTGSAIGAHIVDLPDLTGVEQGEIVELRRGPLAEVFTPVYDLSGKAIGIVRMTTAILLFGVLGGIGLGSYLAFGINRPIQRMTGSIHALAKGDWGAHLDEQGPDEMRTLAQAVNTLVDQLNSLEGARRQLLANLVHELGTPLGAIRSAILALLKGADKDPQLANDLLTGLDRETARLRRLLDDLAGLQDQVLGRLELNRIPVKLDEWLGSTLSPWEAAAREKGLDWVSDISPNLPNILMDPDRMAQAIGNLVSNAIKYTPSGGQISVTAQHVGGQFVIQVADSGPGIPSEEREKIFQPFYRGAHGRRVVEGMGLGLSIARDILAAHGGEIELETIPGSGSRFTVRMQVEAPLEA